MRITRAAAAARVFPAVCAGHASIGCRNLGLGHAASRCNLNARSSWSDPTAAVTLEFHLQSLWRMSDRPTRPTRRRVGRPPAGRDGEKVKDYPQLSIRVPTEFKARLNALSVVTGLAQWRVIVEAINCFFRDMPDTDRELVDGLSRRLMGADTI